MAEDDAEEMRNLRRQFQKNVGSGQRRGRDAGSDDDDGEPSRQEEQPSSSTAASPYKFGSTLSTPAPSSSKKDADDDEETDAMAQIMGFAGFASGNRKSRTFDIDTLISDNKKNALNSRKKPDSDDSDDDAPVPRTKPKPATTVTRGPSGPTLPPPDSGTESDIGPPLPPSFNQAGTSSGGPTNLSADLMDSDSDFSDTEDAPDDTSSDWKIPCAYDLSFEHGDKAVTALAIDAAGARFATGSVDYDVKLWDFGGMQANLNAFRTCQPCGTHAINNLSFSNGGEQILVISGSAQAKIIDREGFNVQECPKGFQFIRDMTHTKGHIAMLTSGAFSPKVKGDYATSSCDESLRLWSVDDKECHKHCLKAKTAKGRLTVPTTCAYSKDGKYILAGCQDGSIQMWDTTKNNFVAPAKIIRDAHKNDITSVCFSYDSKMICSRGMDDTVKLWDLAMLKKPVFVGDGLASLFPQTDCLFSPNDKLIVTGTAVKKGEGKSKLVMYDRATWQLVKEIPVADSSVIRTAWHPKLNQIFATTADGSIKVFFDPSMSHNGALLCRTSKKRRAKQADAVSSDYIITPYALPLFKEEKQRSSHAQFERNRKDPVKSHKPEIPMNGPGAGGRVTNAGGTLSSYLVRKLGYATKRIDADTNPREALLRHAKEAAENPYWVSPAYAQTQPKTIFQNPDAGEESGESANKRPKL